MDERPTYRDIRAMESHYCRENDNIVGFFGSDDGDDRSSDSDA